MNFRNRIRAFATVLLVLSACQAGALSLLSQHSSNGALLSAEILRAGFAGGVTDDTISLPRNYTGSPTAWPAMPEGTVQTASSNLTSSLSPDAGEGVVNGEISSILTFGGPSSNDTLNFFTAVSVSALSAADSSGVEQDALIKVAGDLQFFIDPLFGGAAPGDYVGTFHMDPITLLTGGTDPLDPSVSSSIAVTVSDLAPLATTDGSTALDVALFAGGGYSIAFRFNLLVPHGIDPNVEVNAIGTFSPGPAVPEPASVALLALGLVLLSAHQLPRKNSE